MKRLLCIPIFLLFVGCQYNPSAHRFLTREPSKDEVVGQYQLVEVHVDMVESGLSARIRATASTIILRADGIALLSNFPFFEELEGTFDYEFIGLEDMVARWEIATVGGVSSCGDDYKQVYGLRLTLTDGRVLFDSPSLTGAEQVDGIIFTLYDGDQGQILGYQKKMQKSFMISETFEKTVILISQAVQFLTLSVHAADADPRSGCS